MLRRFSIYTKTESGASFSSCRRWRTLLWRRWDARKPVANFVMLNPSTADELQLDPTCSRARDYAERLGDRQPGVGRLAVVHWDQPTPSSSTSKISVALGGMTLGVVVAGMAAFAGTKAAF